MARGEGVAGRLTTFRPTAGMDFAMGCGAIGSTSDSGSEGSRFESWQPSFEAGLTGLFSCAAPPGHASILA